MLIPDGAARTVGFACDDCGSDVIVDAYGADLYGLVTHAGPYDGEVVVPADTLVIHVQAQNRDGGVGQWTWEVLNAP